MFSWLFAFIFTLNIENEENIYLKTLMTTRYALRTVSIFSDECSYYK